MFTEPAAVVQEYRNPQRDKARCIGSVVSFIVEFQPGEFFSEMFNRVFARVSEPLLLSVVYRLKKFLE